MEASSLCDPLGMGSMRKKKDNSRFPGTVLGVRLGGLDGRHSRSDKGLSVPAISASLLP